MSLYPDPYDDFGLLAMEPWRAEQLVVDTEMGMLELQRLRRDAEERLGDRFDLPIFHDGIVRKRPVPMVVLGEQVDTRRRAQADRKSVVATGPHWGIRGAAQIPQPTTRHLDLPHHIDAIGTWHAACINVPGHDPKGVHPHAFTVLRHRRCPGRELHRSPRPRRARS